MSYVKTFGFFILLAGACFWGYSEYSGPKPILDSVKKRGSLNCGVSIETSGFAHKKKDGKWEGMDVDICRALSVAIFGTPDKVNFIPVISVDRFSFLRERKIDVLSRTTTFNLKRDVLEGVDFAPVVFFDGQTFLTRKKDGIKKASDFEGGLICIEDRAPENTSLIKDYFVRNSVNVHYRTFDTNRDVKKAFNEEECLAYLGDRSSLVTDMMSYDDASQLEIFGEMISKSPLAPAVVHNDSEWKDIVSWVVYALILADEYDIDSKNINSFIKSGDPMIRRFLGEEPYQGLRLRGKWAYDVIKAIGNYGEIFHRNLGEGSSYKLERMENKTWKEGGLLYAPPF